MPCKKSIHPRLVKNVTNSLLYNFFILCFRYGQKQYKWFPYEQRWSPHNARGKRSVQRSERVGPEGSQPAPGATTHDIPGPVDGLSSMFEGTVGEHSEHSTDPRIYDSPAVTQFQLKTLRTKSPGANSTSSSGSPVPDEPSLSRSNFGQATSASEVSVGRPKIRRGQTDLLSIPSMRGVERVEIQHHKSSLASLTGVDGAVSSEYGKGKPLGSPHSSVPLKSLSGHNINWDRLAMRNIARKGPHGRNEGTIVLPVA